MNALILPNFKISSTTLLGICEILPASTQLWMLTARYRLFIIFWHGQRVRQIDSNQFR
jgi:hypothetical protein